MLTFHRAFCLAFLVSVTSALRAEIIIVDAASGGSTSLHWAVKFARPGDTIVLMPGEYLSGFWAVSKRLTVRSVNPDDPAVVAATVLNLWLQTQQTSVQIDGGSDIRMEGVTIQRASFDWWGGTLVQDSRVTFRNCIWRDNECRIYRGGAVLAFDSQLTFENSQFLNNRAELLGSAICAHDSTITLRNCIFSDNRTTHIARFPELEHSSRFTIYLDSSSMEMEATTIRGEGLVAWDAPAVRIARSHVEHTSGNWALALESVAAEVSDSQIISATVGPVEPICVTSSGNLRLTNCTIVGAVWGVTTRSPGVLIAHNNLFYQNGVALLVDTPPSEGFYDVRGNCFSDCYWGEVYEYPERFWTLPGILRADPQVVTPGVWDRGGTPESFDDVYTPGDYRLRPTSPLINAGEPRAADPQPDPPYEPLPRPAFDAWGHVRVAGGRIDIGAYEFPARGDLDGDGALTWFDAEPFVLALTSPHVHAAAFPYADREIAADINGDGRVDLFDIDPFVDRLIGAP